MMVKVFDFLVYRDWSIFVNLESLDITSNLVIDLSPIKNLTSLKKFSTVYNIIEDFTPLQNLTNLERLEIYMASASDVTPLRNLTNLKYLMLSGVQSVRDISLIAKLLQDTQYKIYLNAGKIVFIMKIIQMQ